MAFNITQNLIITRAAQVPYVPNVPPPTNDVYFTSNSLLLQFDTTGSGVVIDSSTNNYSVNIGGTAAQGSVSPFSASGGSMYFGTSSNAGIGSGYVSAPYNSILNFGTAIFTIEFWIKFNNVTTDQLVLDSRPLGTQGNYPCIYLGSLDSKLRWYINGNTASSFVSTLALSADTWYHVAIVKASVGGTTTMYINGTARGSSTDSVNYVSGNPIVIGGQSFTFGANAVNGYMSNFRVAKGNAVYTGPFTPPTSSLTSGGIAAILLNFENGKFIDGTRKHSLTSPTSTVVSSPVKYGSGSLSVPTGGRIQMYDSISDFLFPGDFTIESWVYVTPASGDGSIFVLGDGTNYFGVNNDNTSFNYYLNNVGLGARVGSVTTNAWQHVAFVRSGTSVKLYLNGVVASTTSSAITLGYSNPSVPTQINASGGTKYFDDYRITKGVARYTASFVPPGKLLSL